MAKIELTELTNRQALLENIEGVKAGLYGYDLPNKQWRRVAVDPSGAIVSEGFGGVDITTDISTPNTIIETDGVKTLTTVIVPGDSITETWS